VGPSRLSFLAAPRLITTRVPQTKLMKWPESQSDFERDRSRFGQSFSN
jgi:hypothetical protein